MSEATADARAKNGEGSRAAKYLEELQKATAEIEAKPFGKGRSLEVEVDVKSIRVKRTVPHL